MSEHTRSSTEPASNAVRTPRPYLAFLGFLARNALLLASGGLALRAALDTGGAWWPWLALVVVTTVRHALRWRRTAHKEQHNAN
jgi:hypothetical protein